LFRADADRRQDGVMAAGHARRIAVRRGFGDQIGADEAPAAGIFSMIGGWPMRVVRSSPSMRITVS
jgi:hypothetical protein